MLETQAPVAEAQARSGETQPTARERAARIDPHQIKAEMDELMAMGPGIIDLANKISQAHNSRQE